MIELLKKITEILTVAFTEWIPTLANADLGPMGTVLTAIAIIPVVIGILKYLKKNKP